jgi:hypothetical protein
MSRSTYLTGPRSRARLSDQTEAVKWLRARANDYLKGKDTPQALLEAVENWRVLFFRDLGQEAYKSTAQWQVAQVEQLAAHLAECRLSLPPFGEGLKLGPKSAASLAAQLFAQGVRS